MFEGKNLSCGYEKKCFVWLWNKRPSLICVMVLSTLRLGFPLCPVHQSETEALSSQLPPSCWGHRKQLSPFSCSAESSRHKCVETFKHAQISSPIDWHEKNAAFCKRSNKKGKRPKIHLHSLLIFKCKEIFKRKIDISANWFMQKTNMQILQFCFYEKLWMTKWLIHCVLLGNAWTLLRPKNKKLLFCVGHGLNALLCHPSPKKTRAPFSLPAAPTQ